MRRFPLFAPLIALLAAGLACGSQAESPPQPTAGPTAIPPTPTATLVPIDLTQIAFTPEEFGAGFAVPDPNFMATLDRSYAPFQSFLATYKTLAFARQEPYQLIVVLDGLLRLNLSQADFDQQVAEVDSAKWFREGAAIVPMAGLEGFGDSTIGYKADYTSSENYPETANLMIYRKQHVVAFVIVITDQGVAPSPTEFEVLTLVDQRISGLLAP